MYSPLQSVATRSYNNDYNGRLQADSASTTDMVCVTCRTPSTQATVYVRDPYYLPKLLAYDALGQFAIGTRMDKGKERNREFSDILDGEKAESIRFIQTRIPCVRDSRRNRWRLLRGSSST